MERTAAQYKRELVELTESVTGFLARLDLLMQAPSTVERGKKVAALCNTLEMTNDRVRYGALGIDFRTDKKTARKSALASRPLSSAKQTGK